MCAPNRATRYSSCPAKQAVDLGECLKESCAVFSTCSDLHEHVTSVRVNRLTATTGSVIKPAVAQLLGFKH